MEKFSMYPNFLKNEGYQGQNSSKTNEPPPQKTEQETTFIAEESPFNNVFKEDEKSDKHPSLPVKNDNLSSANAMLDVISAHERILKKIQSRRKN